MARALINVPAKAKRGEVIEIKTLIQHDMETGFRPDNTGKPLPRNIITELVCKYNGEEIFRADMFPAISANPFFVFSTIATESGTITFEWTGDNGFSATSRPRSASNDAGCGGRPGRCLDRREPRSPPRSRLPTENPATSSWAPRRAPCRTTTPPIPARCRCSTARPCGVARPAPPANHAPIATATRRRA